MREVFLKNMVEIEEVVQLNHLDLRTYIIIMITIELTALVLLEVSLLQDLVQEDFIIIIEEKIAITVRVIIDTLSLLLIIPTKVTSNSLDVIDY